jgi:hypothetical protein
MQECTFEKIKWHIPGKANKCERIQGSGGRAFLWGVHIAHPQLGLMICPSKSKFVLMIVMQVNEQ